MKSLARESAHASVAERPLAAASRTGAARRRGRRRLDATGLIGGGLLAAIILACLAAPVLTRADPLAVDLLRQFEDPSWAHPFGTDSFGRASSTAGGSRWRWRR
jgi:peptide/nickel transport system permease protein